MAGLRGGRARLRPGRGGDCDATLAIGCRFGEVATGSYGLNPPSPLLHVDIDPSVPGRNFPADVAVCCDSAQFVRALLPMLPGRAKCDELRNRIHAGRAEAAAEIQSPSETGVSPGRLLKRLQELFGPETIFTTDSGNGTFLAIEGLTLDKPGRLLGPMDYSCMGYSVPAAIGAKLACPEVPVAALAGDGAFLMTGLELLTAASQGVAAAFLVLRDRELAQIAQFQGVAYNRKACSELPDYDLAAIAAGTGVECLQLKTDADIAPVLDRAKAILSEGRPVAIDVAIDYSRKTFFTKGVVRTTLGRLPWMDRIRFVGRAVGRKLFE
ncbi:MAG: thiamine pyrophosphate-binding protein [Holophagaceae bacterium]|nr:thiamine pyrophosphate-binding protein [Holophagaceae bacterium]